MFKTKDRNPTWSNQNRLDDARSAVSTVSMDVPDITDLSCDIICFPYSPRNMSLKHGWKSLSAFIATQLASADY